MSVSDTTKHLAAKLEKLGVAARLQDLAFFMVDGEPSRIQKIQAALDHLDPGVYLAGTGPYTQGVYSLMCDEVVVGRLATVLEKPLDQPVDILVNDAASLNPREVSRVHCSIYRQEGVEKHDYWIIDRGSTCGTYVNGEKLESTTTDDVDEIRRVSRSLTGGDIISLGPSLVNTFLFVDLRV
jgi:hypothetical protein